MKELSIDETHALIDSFVKSFGQRGAARALTKNGYRSPEGKEIQHGTISRILNGSETRLLAPEVKDLLPGPEQAVPPEIAPKAPLLVGKTSEEAIAVPLTYEEIATEEARRELHTKTRKALREELQDEIAAQKLKESELPALVPAPSDYSTREHTRPSELARVTGIFTRRGPAPELEEEKTYYGLPVLKRKAPLTTSQPHEPRSFGANVITTRDLSIRQRNGS